MKKIVFNGALFLISFSFSLFLVQSSVEAAPLGICVNIAAGDWANTTTWQCFGASNPPGANDDVYIQYAVTASDARSAANMTIANGGTLSITTGSLTMNNLTIDAGGTLNCNSNTVTFKGNLTNSGSFNCNAGTANFEGTIAQSLGGSSSLILNNLTVNNAANVMLSQNVTVNGTLALTNGDLNTASFVLNLGSHATVTAAGGGDVVGSVQRAHTFSTGTNYTFNSPFTAINFGTLATPPTDITINLVKAAPTGLSNAVPREYTISASGGPVFTGVLQLHYKTAEGGFTNETFLRPWKFVSGLGWQRQAGSVTINGNHSFVQATNVASFSPWGIAEFNGTTAVKLSTFTANPLPPSTRVPFELIGAFWMVLVIGGWSVLRHLGG